VRSYATPPTDWKIIATPVDELTVTRCMTPTRHPYRVVLSRDSSTLFISPDSAFQRRADTLRVNGGRLIAFDGGEFGGRISWQPDSGVEQPVASVNSRALIQIKDTVWALAGLAHLTTDRGELIRLERVANGWRIGETRDLGAAPQGIIRLPSDTMLVLASRRLILIPPSHQPQVLYENPRWINSFPANIVRDRSGAIYLGTQSGVVRLSPQEGSFKEEWLVPNSCDTTRR
jgi:hypothetical protein